MLQTETIHAGNHAKPTPPGWTRRQILVFSLLWLCVAVLFVLMVFVAGNHITFGGFVTRHNRMYVGLGIHLSSLALCLAAMYLRRHYNTLARPSREQWCTEREALDAAHGLVPGETLMGLVVIASDAERLLLRGQSRLYLNLCLRVFCLLAAAACIIGGLIFGLRVANWPLFLISAIVAFICLLPYTHRIMVSPTAADGEPGILFERRKWICFRYFRALPFTRIASVGVEIKDKRPNCIHLWLYGTDGRRIQFATSEVNERKRLQARRLRNAILTRNPNSSPHQSPIHNDTSASSSDADNSEV